MIIKRSQIDPLISAIQSLDVPIVLSSEETTVDGKTTSKTITKKIVMSGETRCDLARNLKLLKAEQESIQESRMGLFKQNATEEEREAGVVKGKSATKFNQEVMDLMATSADLPLKQMPLTVLNIKEQPVSMDAIAVLLDVVFAEG